MMPPELAVLIVEDNEDDRFLLAEAIRAAKLRRAVRFVNDGREAVAYLSGDGAYADRLKHPLPGLVLLDVKLPLMNGAEVLRWIRGSEHRRLPVVMLSASALPGDIERAYDLCANAYVMKPSTLEALVELMRSLDAFWLAFNEYARIP